MNLITDPNRDQTLELAFCPGAGASDNSCSSSGGGGGGSGGGGGGSKSEGDAKAPAEQYHVYMKGGSVGGGAKDHPTHGNLISTHASKPEADAKASRMNKSLSPGEKGYYGMKFHVKTDGPKSKS